MRFFDCPALGRQVELTDEREEHIELRHPTLLPDYLEELQLAVENPQQVGYSILDGNLMLARWSDRISGGRFVVVVIAADLPRGRHWIVTAFLDHQIPDEMQ
jgi:hypothetical protein